MNAVDEVLKRLSRTRANALHSVWQGRHFDVHLRELRGLDALGLVRMSQVHGTPRPTSVWLTPFGQIVHNTLAEDGACFHCIKKTRRRNHDSWY